MGNFPCKSEGGSGGKRGHSNMTHYTGTEEIKSSARKKRRQEAADAIEEQIQEMDNTNATSSGKT